MNNTIPHILTSATQCFASFVVLLAFVLIFCLSLVIELNKRKDQVAIYGKTLTELSFVAKK